MIAVAQKNIGLEWHNKSSLFIFTAMHPFQGAKEISQIVYGVPCALLVGLLVLAQLQTWTCSHPNQHTDRYPLVRHMTDVSHESRSIFQWASSDLPRGGLVAQPSPNARLPLNSPSLNVVWPLSLRDKQEKARTIDWLDCGVSAKQ